MYNGVYKYITKETTTHKLPGYFLETLNGTQFIKVPVSLAKVAGKTGNEISLIEHCLIP